MIIDNFQIIREQYNEFSRGELPRQVPKIIESKDDLKEIYQLALDNWIEKFNLLGLMEILRWFFSGFSLMYSI